MKKTVKIFIIGLSLVAFVLLAAQSAFYLVWNGVILLNNPSRVKYPVRGVDVSHYQGEIDWKVLCAQNVDFAFIKATEGSSFVDDRFLYNFKEAQKCDVSVGAYHFFSFDSSGEDQAQNFINTVGGFDGMLPPVIDVEFYGAHAYSLPDKQSVLCELDAMIGILTEHYGVSPVLYATEEAYEYFIAEGYENHPIWIRNVKSRPWLSDGREWTFWQYTNREVLRGYSGEEKFIDMNVFSGSVENFAKFPRCRE